MAPRINERGLRDLFLDARTHNAWLDTPVPDSLLRELYDVVKFGPTSMNTQPMRLCFLRTAPAKERLKPHLAPGNVDKTMAAPVIAIVGYDLAFHEHLPALFPHLPNARAIFEDKLPLIEATAFRNSSLQGAYLVIAARALGLDCGPMSGFNNAGVDQEFFRGTQIKSNFLCNLGYGDQSKVFARSPRLEFKTACAVL
ncbi:malonic semialdehyde reductase [Bradyrhizobium ganzhouense]|uniref:malonic semialdehyde reductase n=1 Tax=Bradyrhizobium ganzhouense TaxID=1179767 RepID=UPI003CECD731